MLNSVQTGLNRLLRAILSAGCLDAALALWYDESFRTAAGCWLWHARAAR